ncbi:MAG: aminotransferase class I/II-fold pyridoxal phosphate-dependent enzyme, partial [Deltaproteobacteria bacterium]|nr:aminotransferase class I/II-fold pyridoxal phosphate-dependent enzyme [Deltaproteobacteria bacterium]
MRIADSIERLGVETAFAVSAEAAAFAAEGNKVYPFHLGDIDIMTPSNIVDAAEKALRRGKTGYCPNAGIPQLRELLADDISRSHGIDYTMENVSIQPGGKPVIGKFLRTLMNPGDEVLYPNPGFPIYESQIEFQGGRALPYGFVEGKKNFKLDMAAIEGQIT